MTAPTGYEPGGARTLVKDYVYTTDALPPANFPTPDGVFGSYRAEAGVPPFGVAPPDSSDPSAVTVLNPVPGSTYQVVTPIWSGQPQPVATPITVVDLWL